MRWRGAAPADRLAGDWDVCATRTAGTAGTTGTTAEARRRGALRSQVGVR
jgi:hypothetical protein